MQDYWTRQNDAAVFQDLHWKRPERKSQAGSLLIIGGNGNQFAQTQFAYQRATTLGVGACKVILPSSASKLLGPHPDIEYVESTSKGSFSLNAEQQLKDYMSWADAVLLPGELGRNSETTQMIEHIISAMSSQLILTRDAIDILEPSAKMLLNREDTIAVLSIAQLQALAKRAEWPTAVRFQMSLPELVEQLHEITAQHPIALMVYFQTNLVSAVRGEVITTKLPSEPESWRLHAATEVAAWSIWVNKKQAMAHAAWGASQS